MLNDHPQPGRSRLNRVLRGTGPADVRWWLWPVLVLSLAGGVVGALLARGPERVWVYTAERAAVRLTLTSDATVGSSARYWLFFGAALAASEGRAPNACAAFPQHSDPAALLGRVTSLQIGSGTHVVAGGILATADTGPADTALVSAAQGLRDAQALLAADRTAVPRTLVPAAPNVPTPTPAPSADAAGLSRLSADAQIGADMDRIARLQQAVTAAQDARAAAVVTAPVDGVVEQVTTAVGALPTCSTPALVMRSDALTAHTTVPEGVVTYIQGGQDVRVAVPATRQVLHARVAGFPGQAPPVGPAVPQGAGGASAAAPVVFPLDLPLPNPPAGLLPGMRATATFTVVRTGLAVPTTAVRYGAGGATTVLVCPSGPAGCHHRHVAVPVTIGLVGDTLTQITSGLAPGAAVILPKGCPATSCRRSGASVG
ncbi:efflux RND transporter periplasmic adaptor subunit [Streptacidiphilus melanogenes]|uniref:efflux RND transporter periplasmic adaptor subunit n=1 Tax=Streptacidiphilus melanogenes TaxID=411235 RepID=UPI001269C363|nr:hypothetical protein [Streptacidiphilus melanogenes]